MMLDSTRVRTSANDRGDRRADGHVDVQACEWTDACVRVDGCVRKSEQTS